MSSYNDNDININTLINDDDNNNINNILADNNYL